MFVVNHKNFLPSVSEICSCDGAHTPYSRRGHVKKNRGLYCKYARQYVNRDVTSLSRFCDESTLFVQPLYDALHMVTGICIENRGLEGNLYRALL